jgi:hypothetical protein
MIALPPWTSMASLTAIRIRSVAPDFMIAEMTDG